VAKILLNEGAALNALGYHIQQAAEKSLKGFLLTKGAPPRRVHDIEELLDEAVSFAPHLERYRSLCGTAAAFSVVARYPGIAPTPMDDWLIQTLRGTRRRG